MQSCNWPVMWQHHNTQKSCRYTASGASVQREDFDYGMFVGATQASMNISHNQKISWAQWA